MVAMSSFVGEVRKLQNDMESRPSEDRIKHMIDQMDTVFKQNMVGYSLHFPYCMCIYLF